MANGRFEKGNPGKPKGAKNKTTLAAKEAFHLAFDELGGWSGLVRWARNDEKNLTVFYQLYSKLIPMDVTSGGERLDVPSINLSRD